MGALVGVLIVGLIIWSIYLLFDARRTYSASVGASGERVEALVTQTFTGRTWKVVGGQGRFNAKPMLKMHAPTFSIDWTESGSGNFNVEVWVSEFTSNGIGMIHHPFFIWRKKRKLMSRLAEA